MNEVKVGGLRIAYERVGHGPAIVLVHGFVGDARSTWQHQLDGLSDEFDVVAWDGPGAGRSSDPPESFRIADFADTLAGFVDALELRRPHVVGLSFGGTVAIGRCATRPGLVSSLVLAGAYAGWLGSLGPQETDERLRLSLAASELPGPQFAAALAPTMF